MNTPFTTLGLRMRDSEESARQLRALIGFDAAVDWLYSVVRERSSPDEYVSFPLIETFGEKVCSAAGKSALIELDPKRKKIGGNGPIMALALVAHSDKISCIGPFGDPLDEAFEPLQAKAHRLYSIGQPAVTHALEFEDGKIMLPVLTGFKGVHRAALNDRIGCRRLIEEISESRLIALVNWSSLPHLSDIFSYLTDEILPECQPDPKRIYFFDLADTHKHGPKKVREVINQIAAFTPFGKTVLGMNLNEATQVAAAINLPEPSPHLDSLVEAAHAIQGYSGVHTVVIHPLEGAVGADPQQYTSVVGPFCAMPSITTGAGDHFNAGFCLGFALEWSLVECLEFGVLTSGCYVRSGQSPTFTDIQHFLTTISHPL